MEKTSDVDSGISLHPLPPLALPELRVLRVLKIELPALLMLLLGGLPGNIVQKLPSNTASASHLGRNSRAERGSIGGGRACDHRESRALVVNEVS